MGARRRVSANATRPHPLRPACACRSPWSQHTTQPAPGGRGGSKPWEAGGLEESEYDTAASPRMAMGGPAGQQLRPWHQQVNLPFSSPSSIFPSQWGSASAPQAATLDGHAQAPLHTTTTFAAAGAPPAGYAGLPPTHYHGPPAARLSEPGLDGVPPIQVSAAHLRERCLDLTCHARQAQRTRVRLAPASHPPRTRAAGAAPRPRQRPSRRPAGATVVSLQPEAECC